jgi:hypothetical protein
MTSKRAQQTDQKTAILNIRVQPLTKEQLQKAAAASGRTVSAEAEFQLHRALFEMRAPLWPILKTICAALAEDPELKKNARWAEDPALYDRAVNMFNAVLEVCRPQGSVPRRDTQQEKDLAVAYALDLLNSIKNADASVPLKKQTPDQRALLKAAQELQHVGAGALVNCAANLWQATQRLMATPGVFAATANMIANAKVMRKDPVTGNLVPVSELEKKETKKRAAT